MAGVAARLAGAIYSKDTNPCVVCLACRSGRYSVSYEMFHEYVKYLNSLQNQCDVFNLGMEILHFIIPIARFLLFITKLR